MIIRKICVFGADIIGASTACAIALKCPEMEIVVVDDNVDTVMQWNLNKIPIIEPGIEEALKKCRNKNLFFTCSSKTPVKEADLIFVCTNSPLRNLPDESGGKASRSIFLEKTARFIASCSETSKIVVERSAVHVRVTETLNSILKANEMPGVKLIVVSNPPFIFEGSVMHDMLEPHRVVVAGEQTPEGMAAVEVVVSLYANWVPKQRIIKTDVATAELSRIATSAFLAQKMMSINCLMELCEVSNADINEIVKIISMDSRMGTAYFNPYLGFSGSVFYRDVEHLVELSKSLNLPEVASYWQKIIDLNQYQRKRLIQRIIKCFFNSLLGKKIAIFGLFYMKHVSSVMDSPTYYICNALLEECAQVNICDTSENKEKIKDDIKFISSSKTDDLDKLVVVTDDPYVAAADTHGIVVCSDSNQFKSLDYKRIHKTMIKPACIFDVRRTLPLHKLRDIGFNVHCIGKHL